MRQQKQLVMSQFESWARRRSGTGGKRSENSEVYREQQNCEWKIFRLR